MASIIDIAAFFVILFVVCCLCAGCVVCCCGGVTTITGTVVPAENPTKPTNKPTQFV